MTFQHAEHLCRELMGADTSDAAVAALRQAGYWDDPKAWRPLGDNPGNLSIVANQQSDPVAALAEKLTNAVDARLINACWATGANPQDPDGPNSPRAAVARFIDCKTPEAEKYGGDVWDWPNRARIGPAEKITVAVTGGAGKSPACVSVADAGEGQSPSMFAETLCSLASSNKDRIPFAQGRYNMGGSGSLRFCGPQHLQLIVSRRNPHIPNNGADGGSGDAGMWGFTVLRRQPPRAGHKNSVYTYLAPLDADRTPGRGEVLRFPADELEIFPDDSNASTTSAPIPYGRTSGHGTLIKLYDYLPRLPKQGVCVTTKFSLLRHLEVCLLDLALPAKVYDCRAPSAHKTHPTNSVAMYGLASRLGRHQVSGEASAMEAGFPDRQALRIEGQEVSLTVYAFALGADKIPKARMYRSGDYGMAFGLNNQTQARRSWQFFHRKEVGLSLLSNSLLVHVDCTALSPQARDDLFMASRDRIADTGFSKTLIEEISKTLKDNPKLKELKERRTRELSAGSADAAKAAERVIRSLYDEDRDLLRFLLEGRNLPMPPAPPEPEPFVGKRHPSYFRHSKDPIDRHVHRQVLIGRSCTLTFHTDAVDDYFTRDLDPGDWDVRLITEPPPNKDDAWGMLEASHMRLRDGEAHLAVKVKDTEPGEVYRYELIVSDNTTLTRFSSEFTLEFIDSKAPKPKPPPPPRYKLPEMKPVKRPEWQTMSPPFTETTAVRVYHSGTDAKGNDTYDWFWNEDNAALVSQTRRAARSRRPGEAELIRTTFYQAMLLTGVSALRTHERIQRQRNDNDGEKDEDLGPLPQSEDFVAHATSALAPVAWHIIKGLSQLEETAPSDDGDQDATG